MIKESILDLKELILNKKILFIFWNIYIISNYFVNAKL